MFQQSGMVRVGAAARPAIRPYPRCVDDAEGDLDGWTFWVEETSAGVYLVRGTDQAGRTVQSHGDDEEALMAKCRAWAADLTRQARG
jgi:hypothetical protein